jgi:hypothetical protein
MAPADAQHERLLELLREAAEEPTAFAELHVGGVSFPAAVISELELNGYPIERVYDHTPPLAKNAPELPGPGMPRRGVAPAFSVCVERASTSHSRLARQRREGNGNATLCVARPFPTSWSLRILPRRGIRLPAPWVAP